MSKVLPRSLLGRFSLLLVIALIVTQAIAVAIFMSETSRVRRAVVRTHEVDRIATLVRVIDAARGSSRNDIIRAFGSRRHHYWTSETPLVATGAMGEAEQRIASRLPRLTRNRAHDPRIALVERNSDREDDWAAEPQALPQAVNISVQLTDGVWLNGEGPLRLPALTVWRCLPPSAMICAPRSLRRGCAPKSTIPT
jgi:hypothetical protein